MIEGNGEDRAVSSKVGEVLSVNDGGQRVDRFVLHEDRIPMGDKCFAQRGSTAWADPDDDPLRCPGAIIE